MRIDIDNNSYILSNNRVRRWFQVRRIKKHPPSFKRNDDGSITFQIYFGKIKRRIKK
jgi:hypothetical protein